MMHVWSPEETTYLISNYYKMSAKEIAKALGLKTEQVRSKIARMKLRKWKGEQDDNRNI